MRYLPGILLALLSWCPLLVHAAEPDPRSVERYGAAYRYPQAGWIVVHIEGPPYERGVQHGRLLSAEIAAYVRCLAAYYGPKAPAESWKQVRRLVAALFLRGFTQEQLQEMQGIADGASLAGARFEGRPIDLSDIVAFNSAPELDCLDEALAATPTGLEALGLRSESDRAESAARTGLAHHPRPMRCSAFVATAPATRDGKVVLGHITMYELYPANYFNVGLDVGPERGHRFAMQTYPGGMQSGMDYALNEAGILICETTLDQTGFDVRGLPLASRSRRAIQYADSIEAAVETLATDNNGLVTNEWLLADVRRNEIALLALGTHHHKLYRSSRKEWIAGAAGFYWSCNNTKDAEVRLETVPSLQGQPSAVAVFAPSKRDILWLATYDRYHGQIDADFARRVLTTPGLVADTSLDAKYTTSALAGQLKSWATFGPSVGPAWQPSFAERRQFPEAHLLVGNPWVLLDAQAPPQDQGSPLPVVDLHESRESKNPYGGEVSTAAKKDADAGLAAAPAWHGTLLPQNDADIWLSTAFANYERIVALEQSLREQSKQRRLGPAELDQLGVALFAYRSMYELGARAGGDLPLSKVTATPRDANWYKLACGKGVLLLHSLRGLVGPQRFDCLMDSFGRAHAGREVSAAALRTHFEKSLGKSMADFFDPWLNRTGLPRLELRQSRFRQTGETWATQVTIARDGTGMELSVPVIVETAKDETSHDVRLEKEQETLDVETQGQPVRLVVDKYGLTARSNGGPFTILAFEDELEQSLIVSGTLDEGAANAAAARTLQESLRRREHNMVVPIKDDGTVTEDELKNHHLLLIGRPGSNRIIDRWQSVLPVQFGQRSFEVRGEVYAHPESAVILALENPLNRRYAAVVIAGLGSLATLRTVSRFGEKALTAAEAVVLPYSQDEFGLVLTPKELTREGKE